MLEVAPGAGEAVLPVVPAGVLFTVLAAEPLVAVDAAEPVLALVEAAGEALAPLVPPGVSALTNAWKSCCSFETALSLEVDDDGFNRLCSKFCKLLARLP